MSRSALAVLVALVVGLAACGDNTTSVEDEPFAPSDFEVCEEYINGFLDAEDIRTDGRRVESWCTEYVAR